MTKLSSAEVIRTAPLFYASKKVRFSTLQEVSSVLIIRRLGGLHNVSNKLVIRRLGGLHNVSSKLVIRRYRVKY